MAHTMFQFHEASARLRPHILGVFSIEVEKGELLEPQMILPDGSCCLYLNLGQPLTIIDMHGQTHFRRFSAPVLARGLLSRPHFLDCSMGLRVWGIKFRPDVWSGWYDAPLENEYSTPEKLERQFAPLLQICRDNQPRDRTAVDLIQALERIIPSLFRVSNPAFHGVLEEIRYSMGSARLEDVMEEFDIPYKTLERYFSQYVGVTPKDYSKILRISASTIEMFLESQIPSFRLKELGFFDVAHFFKEFRRYFETTPRKILKDLPPRSLLLARRVTSQEFSLMR